MSDFQVGDVVVVVGVRKPRPRASADRAAYPSPRRGAYYRVEGVFKNPNWTALVIGGKPSEHFTRGWCSSVFRKLPPASEEFTRQMRALKPQRVPA